MSMPVSQRRVVAIFADPHQKLAFERAHDHVAADQKARASEHFLFRGAKRRQTGADALNEIWIVSHARHASNARGRRTGGTKRHSKSVPTNKST